MRPRAVALACLPLLAALYGCPAGEPPAVGAGAGGRHAAGKAPRGEGARRMAERLAALARDADLKENPWRNGERADGLRPMVESAIAPREYLDLMPNYAGELLKAGRTREAIKAFQDLWRFSTSNGAGSLSPENRTFLRHHMALSYLRLGEQENCQLHHNTESCLMPIRGGGVHGMREGSQEATRVLTEQLNEFPDDLAARWWLNIAAMTLGQYPAGVPAKWLIPPRVFDSDYDIKRFPDRSKDLGLDVVNAAGGSIAEDFDGDGNLDLMMSSTALGGPLRYFHNDGDGAFTERTTEAGLTGETQALNIVEADYDNDGRPDVLMLRGGWLERAGHLPHSLLHNEGDGTFEDVTERAGLLSLHPTQTAAWLDYDNDGWLDVFIGVESTKRDPNVSELYHNNHDGTFTECAAASGLTVDCMAKGVTAGDYNNDGRMDLYVSCRGGPNRLYRNDGAKKGGRGPTDWQFTEVGAAAGVTEPMASFPTWFFDYDNDGWLDLFVAGYAFDNVGDFTAEYLGKPSKAEHARLYHNERDGTFKDVTRAMHLDRIVHAMGSNFGDLDNDGWLDFYAGTGDPNLGTLIPNLMFRNASGKFFQDVTTSGGFGHLQKGHGVSFADFDNDGDQDIFEVMGGVYEADTFRDVLYENPGHGGHFLKLKIEGSKSNRCAIGARIRVVLDTPAGSREIHRSVTTGGSFGGNPLRQEIGLGDARSIVELRVTFPTTGIVHVFKQVAMDRAYAITEGKPALNEIALRSFPFATGRKGATGAP